MPSEAQHLAKALHNERFCLAVVDGLEPSFGQFYDWAITGMFYSALHYIDAYLDRSLATHPETHADRRRIIARIRQLRPIREQYTLLSRRSQSARYGPVSFAGSDVQNLRDNYFIPLRNRLRALLAV